MKANNPISFLENVPHTPIIGHWGEILLYAAGAFVLGVWMYGTLSIWDTYKNRHRNLFLTLDDCIGGIILLAVLTVFWVCWFLYWFQV